MRRAKLALWLTVLVVVVLSTACAKATPTPAPGPATPTPAAATPRATPTPSPTPTPVPRPSGDLIIASDSWGTEGFDASLGTSAGSIRHMRLVYDPLVGTDDSCKYSDNTGVAEKWVMSPDGMSIIFNIRKGIKFHNGDELTAEDVKFTLDFMMRKESLATFVASLRAAIDRVEVVDTYTVKFVMKNPDVFVPWLLTDCDRQMGFILPKKHIDKVGIEEFRKNPVGSGPYRVVGWEAGQYMRLEAAPDRHWRVGVPKYKTILFKLVPEEGTRIAMLKAGEADIIQIKLERVKELQAAGFVIGAQEGAVIVDIHFHQKWEKDNPLGNRLVREAIALAINREEIIQHVFQGFAKLEGTTPSGRLALGWQHRPAYPYDPERARRLLEQAGYPGGKGVKLVIWSMTYGLPEGPDMMQAIAGYLNKVGIETEIRPTDFATFRPLWQGFKLPSGSVSPMAHPTARADSMGIVNDIEGRGGLRMSDDPVLNQMIDKARAEFDMNKRAQLYNQVDQYLYDNYLHLSIAEVSLVWAASKKVPKDWNLGLRGYDINVEDAVKRP